MRVILVLGDGFRFERLAVEIAGQNVDAVVLRVVPSKSEESLLGLEVTDLQDAVDLRVQAGTTAGERQLCF